MLHDLMAARLAKVRAGRGDHRKVAQFTGVESGVHQAVVRQRADVEEIGIDLAQGFRQSGNAKRRPPVLRLPSPIGHEPKESSGAAAELVVVDREAADDDAVDGELFLRKCLEAR